MKKYNTAVVATGHSELASENATTWHNGGAKDVCADMLDNLEYKCSIDDCRMLVENSAYITPDGLFILIAVLSRAYVMSEVVYWDTPAGTTSKREVSDIEIVGEMVGTKVPSFYNLYRGVTRGQRIVYTAVLTNGTPDMARFWYVLPEDTEEALVEFFANKNIKPISLSL